MNRNLEKRVNEQADLLIQSEKMSSLGVLAAGVAHEINNPICFVHGNLDTIQKYSTAIKKLLIHYEALEEAAGRSEGNALRPLIQAIDEFKAGHKIDFILADIVNLANESLEGTRRVRDIVKELRGFSHADEAERQLTDINLTIDKTLTMMAAGLRPGTEIVKTYGSLPMVSSYPQKLSQVFLNVLMNAAQAVSDNGRIEIATRLLPSDKGDARPIAEIRVTDNGHGIPEGALSKVFDPFFTTKPAGEGTGLGLSISYEIVKLHGGDIILEGTGRVGTTVRILLPVDSVSEVLE
jgi:signal transduction histidine kinase